jgi:HEPN domain-containing protein
MKEPDNSLEWLKRARSNLEQAKHSNISIYILLEDLCFNCQQSAEKSLKALLIHLNIDFSKTHSIGLLLDLLEENKIKIPEDIKVATILTDYAVETRYPGEYEIITEEEYIEALKLAQAVYNWVEKEILH